MSFNRTVQFDAMKRPLIRLFNGLSAMSLLLLIVVLILRFDSDQTSPPTMQMTQSADKVWTFYYYDPPNQLRAWIAPAALSVLPIIWAARFMLRNKAISG
jgi:hypothetical protein